MNKIKVFLSALALLKNWHIYLADYAKLIKSEVVYKLKDGSVYTLRGNSNDRNIFNEVIIHKIYNPEGFEIKDGDIVVDIGAHIGIFSTFASKKAAKVYSFEPVPENFQMLVRNKTNNKRDNITAVQKAVYSTPGKKSLFLDKENGGGHSFYQDFEKKRLDKIETETISFEDVFRENKIETINFLKIDCEGSEYDILLDCPKELLARIEKISMEYHNIDQLHHVSKIQELFESNGFSVKISDKISMLYAKKK